MERKGQHEVDVSISTLHDDPIVRDLVHALVTRHYGKRIFWRRNYVDLRFDTEYHSIRYKLTSYLCPTEVQLEMQGLWNIHGAHLGFVVKAKCRCTE